MNTKHIATTLENPLQFTELIAIAYKEGEIREWIWPFCAQKSSFVILGAHTHTHTHVHTHTHTRKHTHTHTHTHINTHTHIHTIPWGYL